jgi:hypothetical protein
LPQLIVATGLGRIHAFRVLHWREIICATGLYDHGTFGKRQGIENEHLEFNPVRFVRLH